MHFLHDIKTPVEMHIKLICINPELPFQITWLVTTNFTLKRHLSMVAVPKMLKCFDCDTTIKRKEYMCDCMPR